MVYFLNSKVKTHAKDPLHYVFDEKLRKKCNFRLQYSIKEISPVEGGLQLQAGGLHQQQLGAFNSSSSWGSGSSRGAFSSWCGAFISRKRATVMLAAVQLVYLPG